MKIAVNTRLLIKNKLDGIGWFTFETLKRITVQHPEHEFIFLFDRKYPDEYIFSSNIKPLIVPPQARHPLLYLLWFEYSIPRILRNEKPDLFLSPDGFLTVSRSVSQSVLTVIHDINFEAYPKDLPFLTSNYYRYFFPKFAHKANRIATVSEFSKQDIIKRYKIKADKIDVVYNGSNEVYKPIPDQEKDEIRKKFTNGKPFFIFIGTLHPRKNIANLFRAFDEFKKAINPPNSDEMCLVIVGNKMWWTSDIESAYQGMKFQKDVIFTGRLQPNDLGKLTASALAMVYVSTFEGFGIPILEALNSEIPVITSNVTSMPEVAGDAALLVNPFSIDSIKDAMLKIFADKNLREYLIQKGKKQREKFSWQKTADKLWLSIEKTMERG